MPPRTRSHVTTVEEVIGTAQRVDGAIATVRTIRIDTVKLDQALGKAAKPLCDFLEALAPAPQEPTADEECDREEEEK